MKDPDGIFLAPAIVASDPAKGLNLGKPNFLQMLLLCLVCWEGVMGRGHWIWQTELQMLPVFVERAIRGGV